MRLDKEYDCQDWSIKENICMVYFISPCQGKECISRVPFPETCKKCKHFYEEIDTYCKKCEEYNNFIELKKYYKQCRNWKCKDRYFPAEFLSLQVYCLNTKECRERNIAFMKRIKSSRSISLRVFDMYDLDLPLIITDMNGKEKVIGYERVCRICGNRLLRKNGAYSHSLRYCKEHKGWGFKLYEKYNWGTISKKYARKVSKSQEEDIIRLVVPRIEGEKSLEKIEIIIYKFFVLCEECNKLCTIYEYHWTPNIKLLKLDQLIINFEDLKLPNINVHHKTPVYTLTYENIHLIFDFENLICLCQECHKSRHKSRKLNTKLSIKNKLNIRSLEEFI